MAWVYIIPDDEAKPPLSFDTTISENHEFTNEATEHPIEDGASITDHVITRPPSFSCEVYVTNTPTQGQYELDDAPRGNEVDTVITTSAPPQGGLPGRFTINSLRFPEPFDRVKETAEALEALRVGADFLTVVTSFRAYENMVITNVGIPRTVYGGSSINIAFRQIALVATSNVPAPRARRGAPMQNKGAQTGKDADEAKARTSLAKSLAGNIGGLFK